MTNDDAIYYACPACHVPPGEPCRTATGNLAREHHTARGLTLSTRCYRCGEKLPGNIDPGQLCPRCSLIRSLEIERATFHVRTR